MQTKAVTHIGKATCKHIKHMQYKQILAVRYLLPTFI